MSDKVGQKYKMKEIDELRGADLFGIVMATHLEAAPFINSNEPHCVEEKPFPIYKMDNIFLVISGVGKTNSAVATAYLVYKYGAMHMFNIGAAGSTAKRHKVGNIFHITKVTEYDLSGPVNHNPGYIAPDVIDGFKTASLSTHHRPIVDAGERGRIANYADLIDMEGAAFVAACRLFLSKAYLFKIITDTPEHTDISEVIENIKLTSDIMYAFFMDKVYRRFK